MTSFRRGSLVVVNQGELKLSSRMAGRWVDEVCEVRDVMGVRKTITGIGSDLVT